MSLCIATNYNNNFIIAADGRGVYEIDGKYIKCSDSVQKLFVIDNKVIFMHGIALCNMEAIRLLKESGNIDYNYISDVCRGVLHKYRKDKPVKQWIKEFKTGEVKSAIPICLTMFEYHNGNLYYTVFTPENDFVPDPQQLKNGQTLYQGIKQNEAKELMRSKELGLVSGVSGYSNKVVKVYKRLEQLYIEVGGRITFITMSDKGIEQAEANYESVEDLAKLNLIGKNGQVMLDENGLLQTDTLQEADNVDSTHPLKLKFYIDDDVMRIDKVKLSFSLERFRAYSKSVASGGGSTVTSSSGGGDVATAESTTINLNTTQPENVRGDTQIDVSYYGTGGHNHGIPHGTVFKDVDGVPRTWVASGNHTHYVNLQSHTHSINMPSHQHSVTIPSHAHSVSIPPHSHDIDYGIYESTYATGVRISVDGVIRGSQYYADSNIDLTQWITSAGWHTIELSSTQLGRVNASIYIKSFVGSGD
ncbi:hypothetical protein FHR92_004150 [Fontibacillus solani]|uniref:Prophage tail endopeptidase domain-containing protein n=1 Tax=Fontibacillus solani TaxID=1572857 RepID=A0A7W3XTJ3_9BACL|nr:hypothetical protein [Fontibacillus solani]MBA9087665.1 hypothetical protein [Fontibacillus solani]